MGRIGFFSFLGVFSELFSLQCAENCLSWWKQGKMTEYYIIPVQTCPCLLHRSSWSSKKRGLVTTKSRNWSFDRFLVNTCTESTHPHTFKVSIKSRKEALGCLMMIWKRLSGVGKMLKLEDLIFIFYSDLTMPHLVPQDSGKKKKFFLSHNNNV